LRSAKEKLTPVPVSFEDNSQPMVPDDNIKKKKKKHKRVRTKATVSSGNESDEPMEVEVGEQGGGKKTSTKKAKKSGT
jgi:hypothetical protein